MTEEKLLAEEYAEDFVKDKYGGSRYCAEVQKEKLFLKIGFKDGYNKANEWHYVKDELPPEDVPLLCVRGGKIYIAWYYNGVYHDSRYCQVQKPSAWKEIVLPKESE